MFSKLGHVLTPRPREAEHADARLDINRQNPDEQQKKNKGEKPERDAFFAEDNTTVSVEALQMFLQNFLKSLETQEKPGRTMPTMRAPDEAPANDLPPPSNKAAQAISAYTAQDRSHSAPSVDSAENMREAAENMGLKPEEIRTIHALLADLKILSQRGATYITIERSDSFLRSLSDAVYKALNPPAL